MKPIKWGEGEKIIKENVCAECGGGLVVAWGGKWNISSQVVKCSESAEHEGLKRLRKPTFEELPIEIKNVMERKARNEMVQQGISTELAQYAGVTSLTEVEADHILSTIYRGAPREAVQKAIWICVQYKLNPLMKHLFLIPFNTNIGTRDKPQWVTAYEPVMGIQATRLLASRQGRYSYLDMSPRIMTDDEQTKILGYVDDINFTFITILQNEHGDIANGVGKYPKDGKPKGMDKGNTPQNMARIRSERNAFGMLYPAEMPRTLDGKMIRVVDEQYMEEENEPTDDIEGEFIDGEVNELPIEKPKEKAAGIPRAKRVTAPTGTSETVGKGKIKEPQITALKKLLKVESDEGLLNEAQIELGFGVKDIHDLTEHDAATWIQKIQGVK